MALLVLAAVGFDLAARAEGVGLGLLASRAACKALGRQSCGRWGGSAV
jgi:hypothetical protein